MQSKNNRLKNNFFSAVEYSAVHMNESTLQGAI